MHKPIVSVVMPAFNAERYIGRALSSILNQTVGDLEIIVVDDGSSDRTSNIAEEYATLAGGDRIRVICRENGGEPVARNTGNREARGEWIACFDADDWWEPSKLERQLEAADCAGGSCVLVHTAVTHHFPGGRFEPKDFSATARRVGWCTEALLEPASIAHPSILVRREALERIGGYDESWDFGCDIDLYFRLSEMGTFAFVPEYLVNYRIHGEQISRAQVDQVIGHCAIIRRFFADRPDLLARIGEARIRRAQSDLVVAKLSRLYWRRELVAFRALLLYAQAQCFDTPEIAAWRRRALVPDWAIHARDLLHRYGRLRFLLGSVDQ